MPGKISQNGTGKTEKRRLKMTKLKTPVFVTGNADKAKKFSEYVGRNIEHIKLDVDEIQTVNPKDLVAHKLRQAYQQINRPVLVEDVSFSLTALGGELPGPFIKFFVDIEDGPEKLCRMLDGFGSRSAMVQTTFGYFDGQDIHFFVSQSSGKVAENPRKGIGFGFDSIFIPDDFDGRTASQLTDQEYQDYYHKNKPLHQVKQFLDKISQ